MRALSLLVAALLVIAPAALAKMGHGDVGRHKADGDLAGHPKAEAAMARAAQKGLFGKLAMSGNDVTGKFVAFRYGDDGHLENLSYANGTGRVALFERIDVSLFARDASAPGGGARVAGATFRLFDDEAVLKVINNPTSKILFHNGNESRLVTFYLAGGHVVAGKADGNKSIQLQWKNLADSTHGHVVISNGTITNTTGKIDVILPPGASLSFVVHPKKMNANLFHAANSALAKGKLGATGQVVKVDGAPVIQDEDYDVDLDVATANATAVTFSVTGDVDGGRIVVVEIEKDALAGLTASNAVVTLDGTPIVLAADPAAVTSATGAAAAINVTAESVTAIVHVPTFSTHTFGVAYTAAQQADGGGNGGNTGGETPGFGFVAALAALGVAVAVVASRRR